MKIFESEEEYYGYLDFIFKDCVDSYYHCKSDGNLKRLYHGNSHFIPKLKKVIHMSDRSNITIGEDNE